MAEILNIKKLDYRIEADHVLFAMVRLENDSRTLNLSKTLLKRGDSVIIIGMSGDAEILKNYERVTIIDIKCPEDVRAYRMWALFISSILSKIHLMRSDFWWALDIYMLCVGWVFRWIKGGRLLFDAREIYSDLGETKDYPLKAKFFLHLESLFIREADLVYSSGWLDSAYLKKLYGIKEPEVLLNVPEFVEPKSEKRLRAKFNIPDEHIIVAYQGILLPGRGFEKIIEAVNEITNVHFCVIGGGPEQSQILRKAEAAGCSDRVHCTGWIPYEELLSWSTDVAVGLVLIENMTQSLRYALPNKLFEHAMCGTPVIATNLPQMAKVIQENESGLLISPTFDAYEIREAINIITQPNMYSKLQQGAKEVAKRYNWSEESKKIGGFIEKASKQ